MKKQEFIKELRKMADKLENDDFHFINLEGGYIFCNKNFGEISIKLGKGVSMKANLYSKEGDKEE